MWCLVVFQHDLRGQYLPQSKEKLLLKNILCLKGRSWLRVHSHGIGRNKYYGVMTKRMNFNCRLRCIQWMLWAKWERLGAKWGPYTFSKIFSLTEQTLTVPSVIVNYFSSSVFPERRPRKRKKKTLSLLWKISIPFGGIQEHNNL